jgi:predicted RNA methylase
MRIEYHRTLLADRVRNDAFHAALKALIRPGETTVADIGSGTGFLGLLAAKLGAREVFLYEKAEVAGVAQAILKRNRARNCRLIPFASTEVDNPPKVDVVLSETLGNYALEEDIVTTMNDARRRHLKPDGRLVPAGLTQFVAPVIASRIHAELTAWTGWGSAST